jgi:dihydroorotase
MRFPLLLIAAAAVYGQTYDLVLHSGRVMDPASGLDAVRDVGIRGKRIALLSKTRLRGRTELDAAGLVVAPGFIDLHSHLREPGQGYKETIVSGTTAAAAGGFTSVCCMPNTTPVLDSPEWVTWVRQPQRGAVVNVFPVAAATQASKGAVLTDFRALQRAGAVAVSDDGKPVLSETTMRDALRTSAEINFPVIQHAEDTRQTQNCSMNEGPTSFRLGLRGMDVMAEAAIVDRDVQLAQQFNGARLHVAHLSTAEALKSIRRGKRNRARVTCEVTPHHFALTDADIRDYDTNFKMNPPLRSAEDREALIAALADGTVDAIATDHAPHAPHEKIIEFERASFGITGFETAVGLAISVLNIENKIPLPKIVELFTSGPARVLDLRGRGTLLRGSHADVTIFDPKKRWTFEAANSRSKSHNTPFDGWQLTGKVMATIVSGEVVFRA